MYTCNESCWVLIMCLELSATALCMLENCTTVVIALCQYQPISKKPIYINLFHLNSCKFMLSSIRILVDKYMHRPMINSSAAA